MAEAIASPDPLKEYLRRTIDIEDSESSEGSYRNLDIRDSLQKRFAPIGATEIDAFISGSLRGQRAIYLPQVRKGSKALRLLPLLSRLPSHDPRRLGLLLSCTSSINEYPYAYCFRFEEPESTGENGTVSIHGYHHVQLTVDRGSLPASVYQVFAQFGAIPATIAQKLSGTEPSMGSVQPIFFPDSIPAFPLPASNKVEMLVCLLVSLYGWRQFYSQWVTHLAAISTCRLSAERVRQACGGMVPRT
jgi:hypothetical protein